VPDRIDHTVDHPLPTHCDCGGEVEDTGETQSTIVQDIPPVQVENTRHVGHIGKCKRCGRRIVSKLPGMSSVGDASTQVQLGPNVAAMAPELRFDYHVPARGISRLLGGWFGLSVSAGGLCGLFAQLADYTAPAYGEVLAHVRSSAVVGLDETGLRQDGVGAWVWIAQTDTASLFRVELSRGAWMADEILGSGFMGVVCSDLYGAYTRRGDLQHAYCGAHNIREAKKIAEVDPTPLTVRFQLRLRKLYEAGVGVQSSQDPEAQDSVVRRFKLLTHDRRFQAHPDLARLQNRFDEHFDGIVYFVSHPDVPATNNMTERDVRPVAADRKVTGGTRSERGSKVLAHWMTVTQTLRKNGIELRGWIRQAFDARLRATSPPSVFAQPQFEA
jgi:transposase